MNKLNLLKDKLDKFLESFSTQSAKLPAKKVIEAISVITNIISHENEYLRAHQYDEAAELYNIKGEAINLMSRFSTHAQEYGVNGNPDEIEAIVNAEKAFDNALQDNKILLKGALDTQTQVMKILVDGAVEDSQWGYNKQGETEIDNTRTTLSLDSRA